VSRYAELTALPPADLVYAGHSFRRVWTLLRAARR
jgi:hypothetical protein